MKQICLLQLLQVTVNRFIVQRTVFRFQVIVRSFKIIFFVSIVVTSIAISYRQIHVMKSSLLFPYSVYMI